MSIPAQRFTVLNDSYNDYELGTADLLNVKSDQPLNAEELLRQQADDYQRLSVSSMTDPNVVAMQIGGNTNDNKFKFISRVVKDLGKVVVDIKKFSAKDLDKRIGGLIPNTPGLSNILATSGDILCKQKSYGFNGYGKKFPNSINCNGKTNTTNSNCNNNQFGSVLNKISNGSYTSSFVDRNQMLNNLTSLSLQGYSLNMCGVFDAASTGITDKLILNKGAVAVLDEVLRDRNYGAVFDISNTINIKGLSPVFEKPNLGKDIFNFFKKLPDQKERDRKQNYDRLFAAAEIADNSWNRSPADDILAMEIIGKKENDDLYDLLEAKRFNNTVDQDNLNEIPNTDSDFMNAVYAASTSIG